MVARSNTCFSTKIDGMKESFENIVQKLKQKIFFPVYFFYGEEPYFIDFLAEQVVSQVVPPEERDYSVHTYYGKDVKIDELMAMLNMLPMFNLYNIYHIKEAQDMDSRAFKKLEEYFSHPVSTNILLLSYKGIPSKTFQKNIETNPNIASFFSSPLKEAELSNWLIEYAKRNGFILTKETAQILIFSLGNELGKLVQELDKIFISFSASQDAHRIIDMKVVEEQVGISRKYNAFELVNAIAKKDKTEALRIAVYFAQNEGKLKDTSVFMVLPLLTSFFEKLLLYISLKREISDKKQIAKDMDIRDFQLWIYEEGSKNYTFAKITEALKILRNYDMAFKGVDALVEPELFVDLIEKLILL